MWPKQGASRVARVRPAGQQQLLDLLLVLPAAGQCERPISARACALSPICWTSSETLVISAVMG